MREVTSGCGEPDATVDVGGVAAVVNPATRTLYVADPGAGIHVIDAAVCNAVTPLLCRDLVGTIPDDDGPQAVDVDIAADTVYAVDNGWGAAGTVSVIDGSACNGRNDSGCGSTPRTITVGSGASWDTVDQATDTVYVANKNDGTVSVINASRCNSTVTTGCTSTPLPGPSRPGFAVTDAVYRSRSPSIALGGAQANPAQCRPSRTAGCVSTAVAVPSGAGAAGVAVDNFLHTVFVVNQDDDTLSAMNTRFCDGATTSACRGHTVHEPAGVDQEAGFNEFPNSITLVPQTDTAYLVSTRGSDVLGVVNVAHCNAVDRSACRVDPPTLSDHGFEAMVDAAIPSAIVSVVPVATTRGSRPNGSPAITSQAMTTSPTITAGRIHQVLRCCRTMGPVSPYAWFAGFPHLEQNCASGASGVPQFAH